MIESKDKPEYFLQSYLSLSKHKVLKITFKVTEAFSMHKLLPNSVLRTNHFTQRSFCLD